MRAVGLLLREYRKTLLADRSGRWYCYALSPGSLVLLVKDKKTGTRYLMRAWETKLPLGRGRITESIDRYSRYHGQTVDQFAFLAQGFRLNAYGLTVE